MLNPGSGIGIFKLGSPKTIRLLRQGCANRPFYHIVVVETRKNQHRPVIEQLGTYDPIPNQYNEKLISLNLERIRHWIGNGALVSKPTEQLLGLAGVFPIHPVTYLTAWRSRRKKGEEEQSEPQKAS